MTNPTDKPHSPQERGNNIKNSAITNGDRVANSSTCTKVGSSGLARFYHELGEGPKKDAIRSILAGLAMGIGPYHFAYTLVTGLQIESSARIDLWGAAKQAPITGIRIALRDLGRGPARNWVRRKLKDKNVRESIKEGLAGEAAAVVDIAQRYFQKRHQNQRLSFFERRFADMFSGFTAAVLSNPFEVWRTRFMAGEVWNGFRHFVRSEGAVKLFRAGMLPRAIQYAIFTNLLDYLTKPKQITKSPSNGGSSGPQKVGTSNHQPSADFGEIANIQLFERRLHGMRGPCGLFAREAFSVEVALAKQRSTLENLAQRKLHM